METNRYFATEDYNYQLLIAGSIALLAAIVPQILKKKHISAPILYLILGAIVYVFAHRYNLDPVEHMEEVKHITEFVILVALANAGLRIKEPFKWHTWKNAFRLLAITMPLTIAAAAYIGWWVVGLAPATALLFGALISPTDPVLASELQTSEPGEEDTSQTKLGLTAEAGINDGLAFPFTYLAIFAASRGLDYKEWIGEWFLHEFVIKIVVGVAVGLLCGWALYKIIFNISKDKEALSKISRGILSVALLTLPYAITEYIGGYGFLAVFCAACMFSDYEKHSSYMNSLHDFNEEMESFIVGVIFISTGFFIALNYELLLDVQIIGAALIMVLVVRPVAGYLSFIRSGLKPFQKFVLSFYGIRGIGSLYYLAYALTATQFDDTGKLIALTTATILLSVLVHGISARSVQQRIQREDNN